MFRLISPATLPDVVAAEADAGLSVPTNEADAAAARTRADYGRVSRWGLGVLGTVGAALGIAVASFAADVVTSTTDLTGDLLLILLALLVAAALAVPSIGLLIALHRSGRRLASAAAYWAALPYRLGRRAPTRGDWFTVRFAAFSADLFLRLITSALAALVTMFAVALAVRSVVASAAADEFVLWSGWAVLFAAVCGGQFGGVQRVQNGYLNRDPARLFGRR
ncbi:MAG: hypothetical protein QM622_05050 [Microbacterium sp.]